MKKPWGIIALIVWFLWNLSRGAMILFSAGDSVDLAVYEANGLTTVFYALTITGMILEIAALVFLFKPAKIGFFIVLAALLWSLFVNVIVTVLVLSNPEAAKATYTASRVARGLSVQPELYDMMFTPVGMLGVLVFVVLLQSVVGLVVVLKRRYFFDGGVARQ